MNESKLTQSRAGEGALKLYLTGFVVSIVLTVAAFLLVEQHVLDHASLIPIVIGLAFVQFVAQLIFFLHLGTEKKPRWKLVVLVFMVMVVVIIVAGSLWIMNNLNYHMMTPSQENTYLNSQDGL